MGSAAFQESGLVQSIIGHVGRECYALCAFVGFGVSCLIAHFVKVRLEKEKVSPYIIWLVRLVECFFATLSAAHIMLLAIDMCLDNIVRVLRRVWALFGSK
jgi:hypothetical protein